MAGKLFDFPPKIQMKLQGNYGVKLPEIVKNVENSIDLFPRNNMVGKHLDRGVSDLLGTILNS
jgi:hypothetical protein